MQNLNNIVKLAGEFYGLTKLSYIRKLKDGKYRVFSEKGKNMGTFPSLEKAKKRLRQIEFFKHKKAEIEETFSSNMRELNKKDPQKAFVYLSAFKEHFDSAVLKEEKDPYEVALEKTKESMKLQKSAALLYGPEVLGKYLADISKFNLSKINPLSKAKAIMRLRQKLSLLDAMEMSSKKMPPSSAIGSSIVFIKHTLFGQDAHYIKNVLDNIVRNL